MLKKILLPTILILSVTLFTGCIPPFFDGGIVASDYFEGDVGYTTYAIDAAEENGFKEVGSGTEPLENYVDGDEKNIPMRAYKAVSFVTKTDGVIITDIAFIAQSENDCIIDFSIFYGENFIISDKITLAANIVSTVYFSGLQITLERSEKLNIVITNPIELGAVPFRTDSYIIIGQGVENV
jgi:hypothetical protein